MAFYDGFFDAIGLRDWCGDIGTSAGSPMSMAELLQKASGKTPAEIQSEGTAFHDIPFPSLDALSESCAAIPKTRDLTSGVETLFLNAKDGLKFVLDPLTEPLSWALDGSLALFQWIPWFILIPAFLVFVYFTSRSRSTLFLVAFSFIFIMFVDHYTYAIQTLSIIFVCAIICVLLGVPIGIAMSRNDVLRRTAIPVLDMLQTLPTFVYLIPLIFLFSVTESKLYGVAIILYAIVPVIRLTDLGIRLVDKGVIEAATAFGMSKKQKLWGVEIPLALPNIMAGVNQTIMMALSMVVIASLVSAPGLGVLVLRGIRNLELGVGLVAGFCIVLLAVMLDRSTKEALNRIDMSSK